MKKIVLIAIILISATYANAQWQQANGFYGERIFSLAVSGTNIFAGTFCGGIFLTTDNGSSWTSVNNGLTNNSYAYVQSLAVNGTTIFAGVGGFIFRSLNNGSSWTAVNNGLTNAYINSFAVSGTNIFAGTGGGGVLLSIDNGSSWTAMNTGLTNTDVYSFAVSGTDIFVGTAGGVFLSTNNGSNWTAVNNGLTSTTVRSFAVSGTNIFAGTANGVFLSSDNGNSWTAVNSGLTGTSVISLAVSGTAIFAGTYGSGIFRSSNNGSNWTSVNSGLASTEVFSIAVSGTNIFAGTSAGVFLSTNNGGSWSAVNNNLPNADVCSFGVRGTNIFAGSNHGMFRSSTSNGISWPIVLNSLSAGSSFLSFAANTSIFAGTSDQGVMVSPDNGNSWTSVNNGLPEQSTIGYYYPIYSLAVKSGNIFAGSNGGVYKSSDNGSHWIYSGNGLIGYCVYVLVANSANIFAGTNHGVFVSGNNGTSWTAVNSGLTNTDVYSIVLSGTNIFVGTNYGVFVSSNNGTSWTAVNSGLTNTYVSSIVLSGTNIFAGTMGGGVFLSTNNGNSWMAVNSGLTNTNVRTLFISGTSIFAGTYNGGGIWKRSLSEMLLPNITSTSLPNGSTGISYNQALIATGETPMTWSIETGSLPDGLSLSTSGVISGIPTLAGTFNFTVKASNSAGNDTQQLSILIVSGHIIAGKTRYLKKAIAGNPSPNQPAYNAVLYNIDNVEVILKTSPGGAVVSTTVSDANGNYQFTNVPDGDYILVYDHIPYPDTMQYVNHVNSVDLALLKYNIGHNPVSDPSRNFSNKHMKGANVDNNASVNTVDLARISAKIGLPNDPARNYPKGNWVAFDTVVTVAGTDLLNVTLQTLAYGDYDASSVKYYGASTNWAMVKELTEENIILQSDESLITNKHEYFEVPLRISTKMNELAAIGLELCYPHEKFKLISASMSNTVKDSGPVKINPTLEEIIAANDDLLVTDDNGVIRVVFATTDYFDIAANEELVRLGFSPLNNEGRGELDFKLKGTGLIANQYGEINEDAYLTMPKIFVQGDEPEAGYKFSGYPNPFSNNATLTYTIPENGKVKLNVYNAIGKLVSELVNETQAGGNHTVVFSQQSLSYGMYTFKLEFEGIDKSKCMVIRMVH